MWRSARLLCEPDQAMGDVAGDFRRLDMQNIIRRRPLRPIIVPALRAAASVVKPRQGGKGERSRENLHLDGRPEQEKRLCANHHRHDDLPRPQCR